MSASDPVWLTDETIEAGARAARQEAVGPFLPNTLTILNAGGSTRLNSSEAEAFARAVLLAAGPHIAAQVPSLKY